MQIANLQITQCQDCPAAKWNGETRSRGDSGHRCDFTGNNISINAPPPADCPIRSLDQSKPAEPKQT